jgi:hypothetical protein
VNVGAVLTAMLVTGGAGMTSASAASPSSYQVAVTFTRLSFTKLDDGCNFLADCYNDSGIGVQRLFRATAPD